MKSLFIISLLPMASFLASCSTNKYVNKNECTELGGPVLECNRKAILN